MPVQTQSRAEGRFLRFTTRQLFVLVLAVGVLLAILAPRLQRDFSARRREALARDLFAAVAEGDTAEVARVIAAGADPDALDRRGHSPLYYALETNNANLAKLLLDASADPNRSTLHVRHLLSYCIAQGRVEMMKRLLDHGANVEDRGLTGNAHPPLLTAAIESKLDRKVKLRMMRVLLEYGADLEKKIDHYNAMDRAVLAADGELGGLLREFGAHYTPLEAVAFNRFDEVKLLVQENPAIVHQRFKPLFATLPGQEPTLLGMALRSGHRELAVYLMDAGAPLDAVEYLTYSMVYQAVRGGDPELIKIVVARGADPNAVDKYGDAPLHDAVFNEKEKAISALIEAGADVNVGDSRGGTPLHRAVERKNLSIVRQLLAAGADPNLTDHQGRTAYEMALEANDPDLLNALQQALIKR